MKASVVVITGEPGAGKSCFCVSEIPKLKGIIYTNLPVSDALPVEDGVEREGVKRPKGWKPGNPQQQLVKVTTEQVMEWCFDGLDVWGPGYLIIDEAHRVFTTGMETAARKAATDWLALTRHRGITVWLITQNRRQLPPFIHGLSSFERKAVLKTNEPDPLFGVRLTDWWQIKSKIDGSYRPYCWIEEWAGVGAGRTLVSTKMIELNSAVFTWYNSYHVDSGSGERQKEEWEIYSLPVLLLRILKRSWFDMLTSGAARIAAVLCLVGWMPVVIPYFMSYMQGFIREEGGLLDMTATAEEPLLSNSTALTFTALEQYEMATELYGGTVNAQPEVERPRINRVGRMLIVGGELYNAASIGNLIDAPKRAAGGSFGRGAVTNNRLHQLPGVGRGAKPVVAKLDTDLRFGGAAGSDGVGVRAGDGAGTPRGDGAEH